MGLITGVAGAGGGIWAAREAYIANNQPRSTAEITSWQGPDCQPVRWEERIRLAGTATLLPGETLWQITLPPENPQAFVGGRIEVGADGRWQTKVGQIGAAEDQNKQFQLLIVAVPPSRQAMFQDAIENGRPIDPAPPEANKPLAQICVTRTD